MDMRFARNSWTHSSTLISCVCGIRSSIMSSTINAPVRPTPALESKRLKIHMCNNLIITLCSTVFNVVTELLLYSTN